jgi:hypothetical protein
MLIAGMELGSLVVLSRIGVILFQETRDFIQIAPAPVRLQVGQKFDVAVCEDRHKNVSLNLLLRLAMAMSMCAGHCVRYMRCSRQHRRRESEFLETSRYFGDYLRYFGDFSGRTPAL